MMLYYLVVTLISIVIVVVSYFDPQAFALFWNEFNEWFANVGMNLLRITLLVKPVFMILMPYSELKLITFWWLRDYLKTIKGRGAKWLWKMFLSIIYFTAGLGMKRRRQLGITTFLLIFVHAGMWIVNWMNISYSLRNQRQNFRLLSGYIGLLMLFIGYITSNNFSIRLFKKNRKLIQYSAYIALIFALFHLAFLNFWEYAGHYAVFVLYIFLKIIEKKKINRF